MGRARNPYRRAGSWITGTGWVSEEPTPPETPVEPPRTGELRYGYSIADLGKFARLAVDRCRTSTARSETERYDLAWSAIAERLYEPGEEPQPTDLINSGQRAIWDEVSAGLRHDGYHLHRVASGPGTGPGFRQYWSQTIRTAQSPEDRIVERIALYQIMPMLTPQQRMMITTLAVLDTYQATAEALGTTRSHLNSALTEGSETVPPMVASGGRAVWALGTRRPS